MERPIAQKSDWVFLFNPMEVSMGDEIKVADAPVEQKPAESKPADKPVESAGKPAEAAKPAGDDKSKPAEPAKPAEGEQKPSEQLKTLLDEASEEEVKLGPDGKPLPKEEANKVVIPEKYEFKLPEGVTLDEASLALVTPAFKALGLDNTQAQQLVDLQLTLTKANEEAHVKAWETYLETQKTQAKEYFGAKLPEVMRNVARARDSFISKVMQEKLNVAGFANDKDFLETLDKIGRVIGEGKFVEGKRSGPLKGEAGKTQEELQKDVSLKDVYPSMAKT